METICAFINEGYMRRRAAILYCKCQKPMDENIDEFWLGCEAGCDGWFHPKCIGLSEEAAKALDVYTCSSCTTGRLCVGARACVCVCVGVCSVGGCSIDERGGAGRGVGSRGEAT